MKTLSLQEIAELTGSKLEGDPNYTISGVADLETANSSDASFFAPSHLDKDRFHKAMLRSKAGVIFIAQSQERPEGKQYLLADNPSQAFQTLVQYLFDRDPRLTGFTGIHPTAVIHEEAHVEEGASLGPHVVIDAGAYVGSGTHIAAGSYIGMHSRIGKDCILYANVSVREYCTLGDRVVVQPGAVIGSCGFGFTTDDRGCHQKVEQLGTVEIGDDVEIGAATTIDRARFKVTRIGSGCKIDNQVQIAHGVDVGPHSIICGQSGIAGSTKLNHHVVMGGRTAVVGHVEIGTGVILAGGAGAIASIKDPGIYSGIPAVPIRDQNKLQVHMRRLGDIVKTVKELKVKVGELENQVQAQSGSQ